MTDNTTQIDKHSANEELKPASTRKAALIFIFITVSLDMLAMGMIAPVLPGLIKEFLHGDTKRAAQIFGFFGTACAVMQFVFSPVLGSLSDQSGRRPVILLSNLGLGLNYVVMAVAPTLGWLFLGRVIAGITSASVPTAMAYIADVAPPEKRAAGFGMISAAFGLGFVAGPAFGGLLGNINPRLPFWVAAGFSLLNTLYGLFVLPESLPLEQRARYSWRRANPVGALVLLRRHSAIWGLTSALFFGYLAQQVLPSVYVLYTNYRYRWDDRTVGLSLALLGVCSATVGAGLVRPVVRHIGERAAILTGLLFGVVGFAVFAWAPTGIIFVAAIPILSLGGLAGPSVQSLMTHLVDRSEQGQLQGAITSLQGIAGLIGPLLFTFIFATAIGSHAGSPLPGAPFLLSALLVWAATVVTHQAIRRGTLRVPQAVSTNSYPAENE